MKKTSCREYALYYLSATPKTEKDMRVKLTEKGYGEADVTATIDQCKKKWFINDENFAQLYIQSEIGRKGKSPSIVRKKLTEKWVPKEIIGHMMETMEAEIQEGTSNRITKEIEKFKKKWLAWFDIMVKLTQRWYSIAAIKKALQTT